MTSPWTHMWKAAAPSCIYFASNIITLESFRTLSNWEHLNFTQAHWVFEIPLVSSDRPIWLHYAQLWSQTNPYDYNVSILFWHSLHLCVPYAFLCMYAYNNMLSLYFMHLHQETSTTNGKFPSILWISGKIFWGSRATTLDNKPFNQALRDLVHKGGVTPKSNTPKWRIHPSRLEEPKTSFWEI